MVLYEDIAVQEHFAVRRRHRMKGTIMKGIVITAVIVLSIASGYFKGKKKLASLVALGAILGIYVGVYLMNQ